VAGHGALGHRPTAPQADQAITIGGAPVRLLGTHCPPGSGFNKHCRSEIPKDHRLYGYAVTGMRLKHRIYPLAASIALDQLPHLDEYLEGRQRIAAYMTEQLDDIPGIRAPL
jgi:DegT/DnrJ/EryC1/StrS aminotransferase family